jgi:hypothetical protein
MNQYREDTHAQFGNVRMVKEVSSLANQLGRERTLCEIYGAGGWDLRFEDMKRIGDWLEVLGINTLDEHLSYVTLRGARKADHPQSFSYHEPWWPAYHVMAQYFTRVSAALSHGQQINRVLVIQPTTTAWMYQGNQAQLTKIGKGFCDLLMALEQAQVEYDIGCEDVIARHGKSRQTGTADGAHGVNELSIGQRSYHTVVLPPNTETLRSETVKWLEPWAVRGGKILSCGPAPALVDGRPSDRAEKLAKQPGWQQLKPEEAVDVLVPVLGRDGTAIRRAPGDKGILFHHRRRFDDGEVLFLVNTSIEAPSAGTIESQLKGVEAWDCHTGKITPYPFASESGATRLSFRLPPCGSLLLFLSSKPGQPSVAAAPTVATVQPDGPTQVRRVGPNVLTIDYMDVTVGGETKKRLHFYHANQLAFVKNGMERNPWDSAVQFKEELISKKFPPGSGFEATYRFTIDGTVPKPLEIVIERPDLYTITCNGSPVAATKSAWWLDKAFGRIDITSAAKTGENAVTIKAAPMTIYHELEPAYLLGDFSLRAAESGFIVSPAAPLGLAAWDKQGLPFYATGVTYSQKFNLAQPSGRYRVALADWYGSVAKVTVNGKEAGYIGWRPFECDVTDLVQPGSNTIEVTVVGTLKNTLGPHHAGKITGTAWPSMFRQGPQTGPPPGTAYHTIGYGLLGPFVLKRVP